MRILHVVTLVTPDGRYGGPLRVALNQVTALRARGHRVVLAAGAADFEGPLPARYAGAEVTLFPAVRLVPGTGFAGLASPAMLAWLVRWARHTDVVHLHLARDLVGLPAAQVVSALKRPYVVQTHGMIDPTNSLLAQPLDAIATRRLLRNAGAVCALTPVEEEALRAVEPCLSRIRILPNGVPESGIVAPGGGPAVDVLFLARLAPRKRPTDFVRAAQILAPRFPGVTFSLVGPDEGELEQVSSLIRADDAQGRIKYEGALPPERTAERMASASLYVLPAVGEPYGMTIVEAMSVGVPTVCLADCGLADAVRSTGGEVVEPGVSGLVGGIERLLADPARRSRASTAGLLYVRDHATMDSVAAGLEGIYAGVIRK